LAIVEKTHPSKMLPASLGPPIVEEKGVVEEIQRAGLTFDRIIPYGKDSIIIGRK
jgi:hypothetical protein